MKKIAKNSLLLIAMISVLTLSFVLAKAATVYRVTDSPLYETTPTLGEDETSKLVVYTSRELLDNGFFDQSDIYYRRLSEDGRPIGSPVQVISNTTDDQLNDVSGDYIVFTSFDSVDVSSGAISLYRISTGDLQQIGYSNIIGEPRIHGNVVVWVQGTVTSSEVMFYDLNWLGTPRTAESLTGSIPPTFNVDIGDRYVVWNEWDLVGDEYDIGAYDLTTSTRNLITNTDNVDERHPSTSGDWIAWQAQEGDPANYRIEIVNIATDDFRIILDDNSTALRPSVHGDVVAYETDSTFNYDVYAYRISTESTIRVSTDPTDDYLNDVFGSLVAWVNSSTGNEDIYVSRHFTPILDITPTAVEFGDVELGGSSLQIVTISNIGNWPMNIYGIGLTSDTPPDFSIIAPPPLPVTINEGESLDVQVSFTPSAQGEISGDLTISTDATELAESISLNGTGVVIDVPPGEQIAGILDFIMQAVEDGKLWGSGSGHSGPGRLNAFINMIEATGDLIEAGDIAQACDQLGAAYVRTDGVPRPPDFVEGSAQAELAEMIQDLMTELGCLQG